MVDARRHGLNRPGDGHLLRYAESQPANDVRRPVTSAAVPCAASRIVDPSGGRRNSDGTLALGTKVSHQRRCFVSWRSRLISLSWPRSQFRAFAVSDGFHFPVGSTAKAD